MSAIRAIVGYTVWFDGELWVGCVAGVGDVGIDKTSDGKLGGVVLLSRAEIVFKIGFLGYRRVHAASEENGVK